MPVVITSTIDMQVTGTVGKQFVIDDASTETAIWGSGMPRAFTAALPDGKPVGVFIREGRLWAWTSEAGGLHPVIERWSETHFSNWIQREWPFLVVLAVGCVAIVYGGKWALKKLL